jgi:hypothetical protein
VAPQDIAPAISAPGTAALTRLAKKLAAPQEAVEPDAAHGRALRQFEAARTSVNTYNAAVNAANAEIAGKKAAVAAGDLKKEEAALVRLDAQKKRHVLISGPKCFSRGIDYTPTFFPIFPTRQHWPSELSHCAFDIIGGN